MPSATRTAAKSAYGQSLRQGTIQIVREAESFSPASPYVAVRRTDPLLATAQIGSIDPKRVRG
jgi:hypothetical protein